METEVINESVATVQLKSEAVITEPVSKEKRIKRIEKLVYGVFAVRVISLAVGYGMAVRVLNSIPDADKTQSMVDAFNLSTLSGAITFDALLLVLGYFVAQDLKKEKAWAWIGAIIFFLLSAGTLWTLPLVVIALINLLQENVRNDFLKKLDFEL